MISLVATDMRAPNRTKNLVGLFEELVLVGKID
jgi:hypothetical protein